MRRHRPPQELEISQPIDLVVVRYAAIAVAKSTLSTDQQPILRAASSAAAGKRMPASPLIKQERPINLRPSDRVRLGDLGGRQICRQDRRERERQQGARRSNRLHPTTSTR
jgi:hypothetical protein